MKQHRPTTRAAHGSAEFTECISFRCSKVDRRMFERMGGGMFMRRLMEAERKRLLKKLVR